MPDDPRQAPAHGDDPHVGPAHLPDTTGGTVTIDDHGHLEQVTYGDLTDDKQQLQYNAAHGGASPPAPGWDMHTSSPPAGTPAQMQAWMDGHHTAITHGMGMCLADPDLDQWYQAGYTAGQQSAGTTPAPVSSDASATDAAYASADDTGAPADAHGSYGDAYGSTDDAGYGGYTYAAAGDTGYDGSVAVDYSASDDTYS